MSYLIRERDVPTRQLILHEKFEMLLGQKYIGTVKGTSDEETYRKSEHISLSRYKFRGTYRGMYNEVSDRIFFIINGEITNFRVGDEVYPTVRKGDVVFIPKGIAYAWDWGELEYLVMNGPAFKPGSDMRLDKNHQIPNVLSMWYKKEWHIIMWCFNDYRYSVELKLV